MSREKLIQLANIVDAKGLHSLADQITQLTQISAEASGMNLNEAISYYSTPIDDLIKIADNLDCQGLSVLSNKIDKIIELEALEQKSALDAILDSYRRRHTVASACSFCKQADIRKDNTSDKCPFGLNIPQACQDVGTAVTDMEPRGPEMKHNKRVYEKYKTGSQCPFAAQVLSDQEAVNCTFGTEIGAREVPKLYRGSPIYPRLFEGFNTINLDRSYQQYHDFSYYSLYG